MKAATDTDTVLRDIWQRALRVADIGRDDNFFDLGGDSLLAVNLFLEIERQTGIALPITAIYDAPTIAGMVALVEQETASPGTGGVPARTPETPSPSSAACARGRARSREGYSSLVLLKPGKGDRPLFIAHGIGGTVIELAALGRAIAIPDAVYAIQARGLDGREAPDETIDAMVDHYVQEIRAVQPSGPYRLCGYSFGGLTAMEMARRLKAQGQSIGTLILLDAFAHPCTWPLVSRLKMKLRRSVRLFGRAFLRSPAETLARLRARKKPQSESERLHEWLLDQNPALPLPLLRVREAGSAALRAYRPKPYAGRITFLQAKTRDAEFPDDPKRIWRRIALDIVFRTIPGGHRTFVSRHAEATAATLTACLIGLPSSSPRALRPSVSVSRASTFASPAEQQRSGGGPAKQGRGRLVATPIAPSAASQTRECAT